MTKLERLENKISVELEKQIEIILIKDRYCIKRECDGRILAGLYFKTLKEMEQYFN